METVPVHIPGSQHAGSVDKAAGRVESPDEMEGLLRILVVLALAGSMVPSAGADEAKRVLLLHSYGSRFAPFESFASALRHDLSRQAPWALDFHEAAVATERVAEPADGSEPFARYLLALFEDRQPDLVVAVGAPAARFIQAQRERLFPAIPLLLTGLEESAVATDALTERDAVVTVRLNVPGAVEGILEVLPDTERVLVVAGASPLEAQWRRRLERELADTGPAIRVEWLEPLGFDGVLDRVAGLPPRSAVLYGLMLVDGEGVPHEEDAALAAIGAASAAPMFGLFDSQLGEGIVGGRLLPIEELASQAAGIAVQLLQGTRPAALRPPPVVAAPPQFDARQLARWGIDESGLPPGSSIAFAEPTAWERYRSEILLIAAALVVQGGFILALLVSRGRLKRSRATLHIREAEARDLTGRLIHAQEDERSRLARELHDDTTQRLAMLAISAGQGERAAKDGAGKAPWTEMREELARLSEDVHALSYRLHPSILSDLGLAEALRGECDRFARLEGLVVGTDIREVPDDLPAGTALGLFRIAQEALRNVARHAGATRVAVSLTRDGGRLMLRVADDGRGFDPGQGPAPGLGLASMRQRAALMGAAIGIRSGRGRGTEIEVSVPIARERHEPSAPPAG
jgi:signal transduction histidine kinase